jgi:hypothetical protein
MHPVEILPVYNYRYLPVSQMIDQMFGIEVRVVADADIGRSVSQAWNEIGDPLERRLLGVNLAIRYEIAQRLGPIL